MHQVKFNSRRTSTTRQKASYPVTDTEIQRQAKRLQRQQKRLEKVVGLDVQSMRLEGQQSRSRAIRYDDIKVFEPLTDTQEDFFDAWETNQATGYVLYGSAGTGKTFLALYHAILDVLNPEKPDFKKIVIVRSAVDVRSQGFVPGHMDLKNAVYEAPYQQIFSEITGKKDAYESLKEMGKVEFVTTAFLRGITFRDCIVFVDEVENLSFREINMMVTRIGGGSKIIFAGDSKQNDLVKSKLDISGFFEFIEVTRQMPEFRNFNFTTDDIIRSGLVKSWILTCDRLGL